MTGMLFWWSGIYLLLSWWWLPLLCQRAQKMADAPTSLWGNRVTECKIPSSKLLNTRINSNIVWSKVKKSFRTYPVFQRFCLCCSLNHGCNCDTFPPLRQFACNVMWQAPCNLLLSFILIGHWLVYIPPSNSYLNYGFICVCCFQMVCCKHLPCPICTPVTSDCRSRSSSPASPQP